MDAIRIRIRNRIRINIHMRIIIHSHIIILQIAHIRSAMIS